MTIERKIVQKLFESKDLYEASFEAGGSTYKCAFGRYYKDGDQIDREEYFKAKASANDGGSSAKVDAENPKTWPDSKELTYKEAQKYAMAHYNQGGDAFYEAWEDYQFNDYVKQFGPMTVKDMKSMFNIQSEVQKDMEGSGQYQGDSNHHEQFRDTVGKLANAKTRKYKDGHVTSFSAGPELDDFVSSIPKNFRQVQTKGNADRGTVVMADDTGNTIWINKDGENSKIWCYNEPKHAQQKSEEPKKEEPDKSDPNTKSLLVRGEDGSYSAELGNGSTVSTKNIGSNEFPRYQATIRDKDGKTIKLTYKNHGKEEDAKKYIEDFISNATEPAKDYSALKGPEYKKSIKNYLAMKEKIKAIASGENSGKISDTYDSIKNRMDTLTKGLDLAASKSQEEIKNMLDDAASRISSTNDKSEAKKIYDEKIVPYMYATGKCRVGVDKMMGFPTYSVTDEEYKWGNLYRR